MCNATLFFRDVNVMQLFCNDRFEYMSILCTLINRLLLRLCFGVWRGRKGEALRGVKYEEK